MSNTPKATDDSGADRPSDMTAVGLSLITTIADTTWRMFVPTIGFTLLGVWGDRVASTKPWLMFAGIVVGAFFAVVLVRRQFIRTRKEQR